MTDDATNSQPINDERIGDLRGEIAVICTLEQFRELLSYNPETGEFYWLKVRSGVRHERLARQAGIIHRLNGYRLIGIKRRVYPAHWLAWLYVYGAWPKDEIDHIDGDRANNKIANLRAVTHKQNMANRTVHSNNRSGMKGVCWRPKMNRWRAQIWQSGSSRHLGYFDTASEAKAAYDAAADALFGEFVRAGA